MTNVFSDDDATAMEGSNRLSLSNLFILKELNGVESMKKMSN